MATKPQSPSFDVGVEEDDIIDEIVTRALAVCKKHRVPYDRMTAFMDMTACHTSTPLHLRDLLKADDFNFAHDIFGIRRHMNRTTGELEGFFLPRFARSEKEAR